MRSLLVADRSWSQFVFLAALVGGAIVAWDAVSDDKPAEEATHRIPVALVDIARIFKEDREFLRKMAKAKSEVEEFESKVKIRQGEIESLLPKEFGSDLPSGEATEKRAKAAKMRNDLAAEVAIWKEALLQDESNLYYDRYEAIDALVAKLARERDIALVLRFQGEPMNRADRASVLQGVNRSVLYSRVPDLTDEVIRLLNASNLETQPK